MVPDGLAADARGRSLGAPSFAYRWVLDWLLAHAAAEDRILLAPGTAERGMVADEDEEQA